MLFNIVMVLVKGVLTMGWFIREEEINLRDDPKCFGWGGIEAKVKI